MDDWQQLRDLAEHVGDDGELDLDRWRDFVGRIAPMVGFSDDDVQSGLATPRKAAALVRDAQCRVREGNRRIGAAIRRASELQVSGRRREAQQVFRDVLAQEPVVLFREVAESQLHKLGELRVIAERRFVFVSSGASLPMSVVLRVGAPECVGASMWELPFEVVGPEDQRLERAASGFDALEAVKQGLQMIDVELRSLQERLGGELTLPAGVQSGSDE